ncbi:MAG: hypothetical protein WC683_13840 [bacterium]
MALFKLDLDNPIAWLLAPLLPFAFLGGCAEGGSASSGCTEGETQLCTCTGEDVGAQVCEADATWGPCDCSGGDADTDVDGDSDVDGDTDADTDTCPDGFLGGVVEVSAGDGYTCALLNTGGLKCWGNNGLGQLGDGTMYNSYVPVNVVGLSSDVYGFSAGSWYVCAVMTYGGVKCWGGNGSGQLGDGATYYNSSVPVDVVGLSSAMEAVSAGSSHTCALMQSGGVKCWGNNYYSQLGDGTADNSYVPVSVIGLSSNVDAVSVGNVSYTCVLLTMGGLKCWGYDGQGQLGDGIAGGHEITPVDVVGLSSGVEDISAGSNHTCVILASSGVECWGGNDHGQLGDGTFDDSAVPVNVAGLPSGVEDVSAGYRHTCVVMTSGAVMCWGENTWGQLGNGTCDDSATPVSVVGLSSGVKSVAVGDDHTCVVMTSGGVKCWGDNEYGQLGVWPASFSNTPVDVVCGE